VPLWVFIKLLNVPSNWLFTVEGSGATVVPLLHAARRAATARLRTIFFIRCFQYLIYVIVIARNISQKRRHEQALSRDFRRFVIIGDSGYCVY